ncbi:MAG: acyltransferase [Snowella sp.]|nr:acyltransferase [Snowella sp.]
MKTNKKRLAWLDSLRALAVILVVWDHLVGEFLARSNLSWLPNDFLNYYVFEPLAICQYGGFIGVSIFFLISGYIIIKTAQKENHIEFAIKRTLRIFPLLCFVVLVVVLLTTMGILPSPVEQLTLPIILSNIFLYNYFQIPQVILVGVAWSLVVEVIFYLIVFLFLPLIHHEKFCWLFPVVTLIISAFIFKFARSFGDNFYLFAVSFIYIPVLSFGSLIYYFEIGKIRLWLFILSSFSAWVLFLHGTSLFYPNFLQPDESYPISLFWAIAIFSLAWVCREALPSQRIINMIALSSYSIYLLHGLFGFILLPLLINRIGYSAALLISLVTITFLATITYFWIEKPFQGIAKIMTKNI